MKKEVQKEVEQLIKDLELNCKVEEFRFKADWLFLCIHKNLSDDFMREFKERIYWDHIPTFQKNVSKEFKNEFEERVGFWEDCEDCDGCDDDEEDDISGILKNRFKFSKEFLEEIKKRRYGGSKREPGHHSIFIPMFRKNKSIDSHKNDKSKNLKIMKAYHLVIKILKNCLIR